MDALYYRHPRPDAYGPNVPPLFKVQMKITTDMLHNPNIKHMDMVFIHLHIYLFVPHHTWPTRIFRNPYSGRDNNPDNLLDRCGVVFVPLVILDNKDIVKILVTLLYENSCINTISNRLVNLWHNTSTWYTIL